MSVYNSFLFLWWIADSSMCSLNRGRFTDNALLFCSISENYFNISKHFATVPLLQEWRQLLNGKISVVHIDLTTRVLYSCTHWAVDGLLEKAQKLLYRRPHMELPSSRIDSSSTGISDCKIIPATIQLSSSKPFILEHSFASCLQKTLIYY